MGKLLSIYDQAKAKSSEKGFVAQPLALAYLLLSKNYVEGITESIHDDIYIKKDEEQENFLAIQVKNVKNASLTSLSKKDYERLEANIKKGLSVGILLIDENKKQLKPEIIELDIKELDNNKKHKNLWGKCVVIQINNIVQLIKNQFMGDKLKNANHDLAFAAIGAAVGTSFNDDTVKREDILVFLETADKNTIMRKIKAVMNGTYSEIIEYEYSKNMSSFKYLNNLINVIGSDANKQYENFMNIKIVINELISGGYMQLSDIERNMSTLKGEYIIFDSTKSEKNMYKFLLENSFEMPIAEETNARHKSGAAIYWAERYDGYDFK